MCIDCAKSKFEIRDSAEERLAAMKWGYWWREVHGLTISLHTPGHLEAIGHQI